MGEGGGGGIFIGDFTGPPLLLLLRLLLKFVGELPRFVGVPSRKVGGIGGAFVVVDEELETEAID